MARSTNLQVCAVAFAVLILALGTADAAKGSPSTTTTTSGSGSGKTTTTTTTALPPPPPPAATTAKAAAAAPPPPAAAGTTTAATTTTASSGSFDPLVSPWGDKCTFATTNSPITVSNYPSSFFSTRSLVFVNGFKELDPKPNVLKTKNGTAPCREDGVCMDGYEISIEEFMLDVTDILPGTPCQKIPLLGYDGKTPGPLIIGRTGVQDVTRFTNNIPVDSKFFSSAGPGSRGGEGETDLCKERADRYQEREFNGTKAHGGYSNVTRGYGRATVTHHHGMASTSSMDGWAEQFFCHGESKDYVLPNNRAAGLYYHDHAVGITSENTYYGLTGMRLTRPCAGDDPYNVEPVEPLPAGEKPAIPEHHLVLQDMVLEKPRAGEAGICRRRYDRKGAHKDQLWGDINVVNGVPWPVLDIKSTWHRFRVLNASPSRPWNLQFRDEAGKEIGSKKCYLIGSDGGIIPNATDHKLPAGGLLTDVAYRWDIICDFTEYSTKNTTIYLFNVHDSGKTTSETPYFCYSHLIMKFRVSPATAADATRIPNPAGPAELEQNAALPPALLKDLTTRAMKGESDRSLKFGKSAGMWLFNDRGWDHEDNLGKGKHIEFNNVGQNTVELWTLESGGGWIHPVHIHLVDFFCIAWQGDDWDGGSSGGSGWKPCPKELINAPKDVIHIGANVGKITLAARYGPHLGEYMMHCHNGVHEDNDMFRAFMISDASKGLTFKTRPLPSNYTLLSKSPLTKSDEYGDTRNTTWGSENGVAPTFNNTYARTLLERDYYHVFYPRNGSTLDDINNNIYLTTCGRGTYNANDDEVIAPQTDCSSNPSDCEKAAEAQSTQSIFGRRLLRSKHNW